MKKLILLSTAAALLSSCGIYTKYKPVESVPDNLYGEEFSTEDTTSIGSMDWHELFTDPQLQAYIEQGLQNNTDYLSAQLRIEEAKATLLSSKLAFLPSFALTPQGTVSSFDGGKATQTYSLPVTASWELDIFGKNRPIRCPLLPAGNWIFLVRCATANGRHRLFMPKARIISRLYVHSLFQA